MAISKRQPMRSAEIEILDKVNELDLDNRFKIECINDIEIPANGSSTNSVIFTTPFADTDSCVVFAQVITNEIASLFTYTLISCTYSGFSYTITNSDAITHTVALGYVAVKVN